MSKSLKSNVWIALLLTSVLCPLTSVHGAQRELTETRKVELGQSKKEPLKFFQAESVTLTGTYTQNGRPVNLSDTNTIVVWEIQGWSDYTNTYAIATGTVASTSNTVQFSLAPIQSNLPASNYLGFVRALQRDGTNLSEIAVLSYQTISVDWSPDSRNYNMVGPITSPAYYPASVITNLIDRIEALEQQPAVDANLTAIVSQATNAIAGLTSDLSGLSATAVLRSDLDGGWYYPDWFAWGFSKSADGQPDSVSLSTNNDAVIQTSVYDSAGGGYDVTFYDLRTADFSYPEITVDPGTVATASVSRIHYVSSGTATVTAAAGAFSRSTNLVFSVSGITNQAVVGCVTGSAVCAFAAGIDSRLTDGTDKAVYSVQDHTATNYVRNPDSWVADIDLTCVSPWNSTGGRLRAGTLIGEDCIMFANHYRLATGAVVRFVTSSNTVVERSVISRRQVGDSDFMIGRLNSAVSTNEIRPALLEPSIYSLYLPQAILGYANLRPALWIDQNENAHVADSPLYGSLTPSTNTVRILYNKTPVSGDSGSPVFLIASNRPPVLISTLYQTTGGYPVGLWNTEIVSAAAALGCQTNTIQSADYAAFGFINYGPGIVDP